MKAMAINGSPRKKWNTATLLENAVSYGRCDMMDALSPLLDRAAQADILILGSPFYFHTETGEMRSFMERLLFPYLPYTPDRASISPRKISTALVYTMNAPEEEMPAIYQDSSVAASRGIMTRIFGSCEVLLCTDTYQFDDYSKYVSTLWDPDVKARRRKDVFPQDCERSYELGTRLAAAER